MDLDQKISYACQAGDDIMAYLVNEGLIEHDVLFDESRIDTEEDPTGFTEVGRALFELVYNEFMNLPE